MDRGPAVVDVNGVQRVFFDYLARGAPFGPDDGTISPWAVVASLPFAPEIAHLGRTLRFFSEAGVSFGSTIPSRRRRQDWAQEVRLYSKVDSRRACDEWGDRRSATRRRPRRAAGYFRGERIASERRNAAQRGFSWSECKSFVPNFPK
jgi:hypothetical protein